MLNLKRSIAACALALATLSTSAFGSSLDPADMRGIRESTGCAPLCLLTFSAVKGGTEDRTVAHFDISGLADPVLGATLSLSMQNQDPALPSTLDIYSFAGDGTVSVDEFTSGAFFTSLTGLIGGVVTPVVDITALLNTAVANGDTFLSFNLRNESGEGRFFLGHVIDGVFGSGTSAGPTFIEIETAPIPLPAGGVLLASGLVLVWRTKRRNA